MRIAVFLAYLVSTVIEIGKMYMFRIIPSSFVDPIAHPDGVFQYVTITISNVYAFSMLFILLRDTLVDKKKSFRLPPLALFFLIVYIIICFISALFFSENPEVSIVYTLQNSTILVVLWYIYRYVLAYPFYQKLSLSVFIGLISFEGVIAFLQFLKNSVIGSSLEVLSEMIHHSMNEDAFRTRPMGTFWHSNELANWLIPILFLCIGYLYVPKHTQKNSVFFFPAILGLYALVASQSRSAWISFIICLLPFLYILEKKMRQTITIHKKNFMRFFIIGICVFIFSIYMFFQRAMQSLYAFDFQASGWTRIGQIKEWSSLIIQYPLFGVGEGMSLPKIFFSKFRDWTDPLFALPTVVHNVYLIIMSETGIVSLLAVFGYFYVIIRYTIHTLAFDGKSSTIIKLACLFGMIAVAINYVFQPYNSLHQLILLSALFLPADKTPVNSKKSNYRTI